MSKNQVVRFPGYREAEAKRVEASNAMMGLLAGAQLASHLLKLTEGSDHLLPEVFPQVPHIGRFNLTTKDARAILDAADTHLGAMTVPYALALHEDYLKSCLDLLRIAKLCTASDVSDTKLARQHPKIAAATGGTFDADRLSELTTIRHMRNCMIHDGGRVSPRLANHVAAWSPQTEVMWTKIAPTLRGVAVGSSISFGHSHLILTLAVTKELAREANVLLQGKVPTDAWADFVVADLAAQGGGSLPAAPHRLRKARGIARFDYGPLGLTDQDLIDALARW